MSSNRIETLIKLSAPAVKPGTIATTRDDVEQFDSYLRHAAKAATAPEPETKPRPTARTAKEESTAVSTGEQDATASSEDDAVPTEITEKAEASVEELADVAEVDELLVSAAATAIVAQQPESVPVVEVLAAELTVEPTAELPATGQATHNAEGNTSSGDQKTPSPAAQSDIAELTPIVGRDEAPVSSEQVAANLVPAEVADPNLVSEDPQLAPTKAATQATVAAPISTEKPREDRGESKSSEQTSQDKSTAEVPIEAPPVVSELTDMVSDTDKSTVGNEKTASTSSPTPNSHFANQTTSQTASAVSDNIDSHATQAEGESQTSTIDRARFVQRVTNAFRAAQQNDGQIQLRLSPPELGQLRIEIAVRNGVLSANLETETADARRVLLDNLPALRQRLAEQDIRIDKFEVDIRREGGQPDGQAGAQDRQAEQNTQRASAQNRIRTTQTSEVITTRVPRPQATSADASLDVRI